MPRRFSSASRVATILLALTLTACAKSSADATTAPANSPSARALPATTSPASSSAAATTYSVDISPAWKIGQKFGYVADDTSTSSDGNASIHFEADGEVLALLPSGNPQKLAYTVKTLRVTGAGLAQGNFPHPGAVIVVEYAPNNKRNITVYDHPVDPDVADTLEEVLWVTSRNHPDQEIFGPATPIAVGASWPINAKAYLDTHEEGDPAYTSVQGSLTLQSIDGAGDNRVATISGAITDKGQNPPDDPGSFVDQLKFTASAPLNHQGVFKEIVTSNSTFTPAASLLGLLTKNATTSQDTITQEITVN